MNTSRVKAAVAHKMIVMTRTGISLIIHFFAVMFLRIFWKVRQAAVRDTESTNFIRDVFGLAAYSGTLRASLITSFSTA